MADIHLHLSWTNGQPIFWKVIAFSTLYARTDLLNVPLEQLTAAILSDWQVVFLPLHRYMLLSNPLHPSVTVALPVPKYPPARGTMLKYGCITLMLLCKTQTNENGENYKVGFTSAKCICLRVFKSNNTISKKSI